MINSGREWDWMDKRMKVDQYEEMELRLEGWGFDVETLRESEGAFSSLDRRSPRAFSPNIPTKKGVKEIPGFEGTMDAVNGLSLYS